LFVEYKQVIIILTNVSHRIVQLSKTRIVVMAFERKTNDYS